MAGEAFRLVIPQDMLNKLQTADEKLKSLGNTSENTRNRVTQAFGKMTGGVQAFINKLGEAQQRLNDLGNFKGANINLGNVSVQATQNVDAINKLIDAIIKLQQTNSKQEAVSVAQLPVQNISNNAIAKLDEELDHNKKKLEEQIKLLDELSKKLNYYASGEGAKAVGFGVDTTKLQAEAESLMKSIPALEQKIKLQAEERKVLVENARIKKANADAEIEQQNEIDASYKKMLDARSKASNDAAKAENAIYEERDRQHEQTQRKYDAMAREMKAQKDQELAAEYEAQEKHNQKTQSQRDAEMEAMRKFAEQRAKLQEKEQTTQRTTEHETLQKEYEARIKQQEKEYENVAKNENEKRKEQSKTIDDAVKRVEQLDKKREDAHKKEIKRQEQLQKKMEKFFPTATSTKEVGLLIGVGKHATSINQMLISIQNLEKAKKNLDTTDKKYRQTLSQIDAQINEHKSNLHKLGVETENVRKHQSNLMNHAQQLRRALALVFSVSQITGYINKMIQVRGEFELQQRSLQAILQNKDEADKLWQQTVDLAVRSPFRVKELVTYTKQLAAYRIETEKLHDTTKMLSDVSAGLGVDMQRLILAYGQVKAANYLRGTELRQFSEAGINILGELAKYFTELEGRAVSVGEVFERVSKRMVAFSDVEEIFKRVTSEGGVFYRMQEIQAETVKGLISNLYDQVDLMLNDIGKSNDGVLKGAIGLVKEFIENWKYVAEAIKIAGAAWIVYKLQAQLAHEKNMLLAIDFGILTGASQKQLKFTQLLALSWKRVTLAVKTFTKALVANPILLAITAALYAATKLYSAWSKHQEQLEEITKQYKELRKEVTDISVKFTYASNVEEQKKELSKLIGVAKDKYNLNVDIDVKGLEEQEVSEKFNNLRNEILDTMAFTEQMSKAIVDSDTWFGNMFTDGIKTDFEEFSESAQELSTTLRNEVNMLIEYLEKSEQLTDELKEAFKPRTKDESELEYIERISRAYKDFYKANTSNSEFFKRGVSYLVDLWGKDLYSSIRKSYTAILDFDNTQKEATKEFNEFADIVEYRVKSIPEEGRTAAVKTAIDQQGFDDFTREMWYRLANERFSVNITPKLPEQKELAKWQKDYNDFVKTLKTGVVSEMTAETQENQYINLLKGQMESVDSDIKAWDAENAKARAQYTKEQIALMRLENAERKKAYDWLVYTPKKGGGDNEALQNLKKQIQLVRQLADDYEEMWKKYGKAYADANIKSGARRNAFIEVGLDIDDFAVGTRQDEKNNLQKLLPKALGIKGGKIEIEKATADVEVEIAWDLQEDKNANLSRELENMFGNYELSLELQKLNIPPDLANQLFGIDTIDLSSLRKEILEKVGLGDMANQTDAQIFDSTAYKNLSEHQQKELAKHLQKVKEMEDKAQEERLKTYSKYLVKGMDERVRIKIEELRKLEEVEKDKDVYTPQQRADIRSAIQKEAQQALDKQAWDEFKNTDLYIALFEDLEDASNRSLKIMIDRLNSLRESLKDLPPEQLKEIVKQLEKAQDELEGRNPFKKFGNDLKDFFGNIGGRKKAQQGVDDTEKRLTFLRAEAESQRDIIAQYESRIERGEDITDREKKHLEMTKTALSLTKQQISNTEKAQQSWQKILDSIKKGAYGIGEAFEGTGEFLQSMGSYVTDMANKWEQAFGLSDKAKDDIETIAGVAQGAGDMATGIGKAIANRADIGAYMQAASGLMTVFATFGQAHDKKKERQIEREMKLVERLQKVYEDLGETIENAYSLDTLNEATQMSRENLMAQINATERMIEAEKDKKDMDWDRIDEWKDQIEEYKEAMKELEETRLQELGAFASDENKKSGAQAFIDAWMEAYKETGDGLSGLNEQFDEFFEDMVKKQLLQRGTQKYLEGFFNQFDNIIEDMSNGGNLQEGINQIMQSWDSTSPALNEFLKNLAESLGVAEDLAGSTAELGGLQAEIQGITEDQADVLASYWSSVRLYTADTNQKVTDLITRLFDSEGSSNPMLAELRAQTAFIQEIRDVLGSVVRGGHSMGGTGLKVFIS